jgi:hypothetical protein
MSTAPRIPRIPSRGRVPAIPCYDRAAWYETTALRVLAIVLGSVLGGVALHAFVSGLARAAA